jgi:hypothetical protein
MSNTATDTSGLQSDAAGEQDEREVLSNEDEVLLRQINPQWLQKGIVTSQAFDPFPKDHGMLSVDRSDLVTPQESYQRFKADGFDSCAVYGVTVAEFDAEDIETLSDPIEASEDRRENPAHALADYRPFSKKDRKKKARALKNKSIERGVLFTPDPSVDSE